MTEASPHVRAAIADARALLETFQAGDLASSYVRVRDTEVFIARGASEPNPMQRAQASEPATSGAPVEHSTLEVTAPHVATIAWIAAAGTVVRQGQVVVRLTVLDESIEVLSPRSGSVTSVIAEASSMVEFGQAMLTLQTAQ